MEEKKGRGLIVVGGGGEATHFLFLFFLLFLILIQCAVAQQDSGSFSVERSALLTLRSSLGLRSRDWPLKANPCTNWRGIGCQSGRVTRINISGLRRTRAGRLNPRFAVDSLVNLTSLDTFNASGFSLPGSIPDWFGSRLGSVEVLDLRSCGISGAIPGSLGNLSRLKELYLSDNSLTGNIDSLLGELKVLSVLDLSRNFLTGSIPEEFSSLRNLTTLDLSSNFISGEIPASLGTIPALQSLNLSDNSLTSSIPVQLGNLSQLVRLDLSKNSISGSLPTNLFGLRKLKELRIGENELEGQLPDVLSSYLSQLTELGIFDVSSNNFTGRFPNGSFTNAVFNFSNNLLFGPLNFSLVGTSGVIDLSGNYFQGVVTGNSQGSATFLSMNCLQNLTNQRSSSDCRLFYSERGYVFDNFGGAQPADMPTGATPKKSRRWVYIVIGVCSGFGVIVVLVLSFVLFMRRYHKGITRQIGSGNGRAIPETESTGIPKEPFTLSGAGESFTYEQMLHAASDFSELSLIKHGHSGDLYQGLLDNRAPVVIKRVAPNSSYMSELEFFSRISHTRLVPLLGHCLGHEGEKFLVYKYMPNGDLASSFYRPADNEDDSMRSIDWITRLKIATGAAEGLAYLHHECSPPIVHRDVQATSILLDDKFEVRLGSLNEVCAPEGHPHHSVITKFLWKPGTSDQGPSGSSSATCAYDVYCFGKVLLELVTGKIGIGKSDDATTREWLEHSLPYISIYDKELVTKIMDPSLIVDEGLLEEVWAMAIVARSCLNPKASKRPLMKHILRALENPLKVVREESISGSSSRIRANSSRRSWNATFLGSWRQSSSDSTAAANNGHFNGIGLRQPGRVGSHSSGNDHSSSHKRLSSEIFPEPIVMSEMDRTEGH